MKYIKTFLQVIQDKILSFGEIKPSKTYASTVFASLSFHILVIIIISLAPKDSFRRNAAPIKLKIAEKHKEVKVEEHKAKEPEKPKEEKPKPPPPPPEKQAEKPKPAAPPKLIAGVSADSLSPDSSAGIAVPLGNTLMKKDEGIRLTPEQLLALKKDLSADPILIQDSFTVPAYTQPALDANLQGQFVVDVFVDSKGNVTDVQLRKVIGYGMDASVKSAMKEARFIPRKNPNGIPMEGWAEVKVNLEIP